MCLSYDAKSFEKTKNEKASNPNGIRYCWKRLYATLVNNKALRLVPPYESFNYKVGLNVSDADYNKIYSLPGIFYNDVRGIYNGIHVYMDLDYAKLQCNSNQVVVKFKCYNKDLIMYSRDKDKEAVYDRVELELSEYQRVLRLMKRRKKK
jgi:hypothetical protein